MNTNANYLVRLALFAVLLLGTVGLNYGHTYGELPSKIESQISAQGSELINSWKVAFSRPQMRTDVSFLGKLSELLDPARIAKLPNGQADMDAIVVALKHPCCGGSHTFLKSVADHLDDVRHLIDNFSNKPGFDQVITALRNPNFFAQDGASHFLSKLKTLDPSQVKAMEGKILDADNLDGICTNCRFDIELTNLTKLEMKSYSAETIAKIADDAKFRNQFTAYLADAENFTSFEYIFNSKKISDLGTIKKGFQELYKSNATSLFESLGSTKFFDLFGVDNVDDFLEDIVPNLNGTAYNFIKVL